MLKSHYFPLILVFVAIALLVFSLLGPGIAPLRETPPAAVEGASVRLVSPRAGDLSRPTPPAAAAGQSQALSADSAAVSSVDPAAAEAARDAKLESITEAFYTFSPEGLKVLEPLLQDPDPEVREAAVEGIQQLSVPEGIPVLKRAALRARNEQEKKRLLQAADWLALPDWVHPNERAGNK